MSATKPCRHEEEVLVDLFRGQREAIDCRDHDRADALFRQIWAVVAPELRASRSGRLGSLR